MASPSKNILPHLRQPVVGMPSPTGNMPQSLQHNTSLPVTVALPDTVESLKLQCKYLEKQCTMLTRELDDLKETERSDEVDFIKMRRSVNNIDFTSLKEYYEHQLEQFGIKCEELERKKTELQTKNRSQDTTIKRLDADFVLHAIQYTKLKERFDAEVDKNVTQKSHKIGVDKKCGTLQKQVDDLKAERDRLQATHDAHLRAGIPRPTDEYLNDDAAKTSQIEALQEAANHLEDQRKGLEDDMVRLTNAHADEIKVLKKQHINDINKLRNKLNASTQQEVTMMTGESEVDDDTQSVSDQGQGQGQGTEIGTATGKKIRRRKYQKKKRLLRHELGAEKGIDNTVSEHDLDSKPQFGAETGIDGPFAEHPVGSEPQSIAEQGIDDTVIEHDLDSIPQSEAEKEKDDTISENDLGSEPQSGAEEEVDDTIAKHDLGSEPKAEAEKEMDDTFPEHAMGSGPQSAAEKEMDDTVPEHDLGSGPQSAAEKEIDETVPEHDLGSEPQSGAEKGIDTVSQGVQTDPEKPSTRPNWRWILFYFLSLILLMGAMYYWKTRAAASACQACRIISEKLYASRGCYKPLSGAATKFWDKLYADRSATPTASMVERGTQTSTAFQSAQGISPVHLPTPKIVWGPGWGIFVLFGVVVLSSWVAADEMV